jgi:uncharacterized membrane protein
MSRAPPTAGVQVVEASALGIAVGIGVAQTVPVVLAAAIGWDAAAALYMLRLWLTIWPLDAAATGPLAEREDSTRAAVDVMLLAAAVGSLVAVGFALSGATSRSGGVQLLWTGVGVATVVLSWAVVHTVYTVRYARLYYVDLDGGIDFNQDAPPTFRDFAYVAFTIGMTFQVSDTALEDAEIRATALRHALLSFVFVTGIVATTINLVATISSK